MPGADDQRKLQSAHALHQRGDLAAAAALYRELIAGNPRHAQALHFLGLIEASGGKFGEATQLMERSLGVEPGNVPFMENYATALYLKGDYASALHIGEAGLRLNGQSASLLYTSAIALSRLGRLAESVARFDRLLAVQPRHVAGLNEKGSVLARMGEQTLAIVSVESAIRIAPQFADAHLNRGNLLAKAWRNGEAFAAFDQALALNPRLANAWLGRGNVLRELDRPDEALASYDTALAINPDYADALGGKALGLMEAGRLAEAGAAIDRAIELSPQTPGFYHTLASCRRLAPDDPRLATMEALAENAASLAPDERIELNFALARTYADKGDHERSFPRLAEANALKRSRVAYEEAATLATLNQMAAAFPADRLGDEPGRGDPSPLPVFVLGMPRSGTTLIEQILASHPDVHGAGEILDFAQAIVDLGGTAAAALDSPEAAGRLSDDELRRLGALYLGRIRAMAPGAERIVNKTPANFRFVGLIRRALPNARIIHTRRDPVDTCFSCYSQMFRQHLGYAFDLGELGRYYRAYDALMAHWRTALPAGAMLEVQYEDVVADLEAEARRIVAYCGLAWDPRCLDFHETVRPVRTASLTQVRQPLYKSSVGRWRAYAGHLGPLLAELGISAETA
jgi:tetratricopeptide (TPR) repeat protein